MNFVESLAPLHLAAKEIPCLTGKGAPTPQTEGAPGVLYMDLDTGVIYKCREAKHGVYRWESLLTGADKAEIVAAVMETLGGNPVFGIVDEENNIIFSGLPDGSYTVKYEMEDGSAVEIGPLVLDPGAAYTNLAEPNPDNTTDFTIWCSNAQIGSDGAVKAGDGYTTTNPVTVSSGDVVRFKNFKVKRIGLYTESDTIRPNGSGRPGGLLSQGIISDVTADIDLVANPDGEPTEMTFTLPSSASNDTVRYFRLSGWLTGAAEDVVITVNEEIV